MLCYATGLGQRGAHVDLQPEVLFRVPVVPAVGDAERGHACREMRRVNLLISRPGARETQAGRAGSALAGGTVERQRAGILRAHAPARADDAAAHGAPPVDGAGGGLEGEEADEAGAEGHAGEGELARVRERVVDAGTWWGVAGAPVDAGKACSAATLACGYTRQGCAGVSRRLEKFADVCSGVA